MCCGACHFRPAAAVRDPTTPSRVFKASERLHWHAPRRSAIVRRLGRRGLSRPLRSARQGPEGRRARVPLERRDRRRLDGARLQPRCDARRVTAVVGIGFQAPIIMVLAFVPMLFVALGFKYLNQADPDCGTTFTWCARAFGPITGWLGGWGLIFADVLVMASLSQIAGSYTFQLFGATSAANSKFWVGVAGVIWILLMGADLLRRHRGFGAHAVGPARRRDRHPRPLLGRRARQGLDGARARQRSSVAELAQPVRHQVVRRDEQRPPARDLHLLGLGHGRLGQRGDRGRDRDAGPRGGREHVPAARDLRRRLVRGPGLPRRQLPEQQLRRRARRARQGRARVAVGQAADHRRAHVRVGLDADDDPADDARDALDGEPRRAAEVVRQDPSALPDARATRRLDVRASRSRSSSCSTPSRATSSPTRSPRPGSASRSTTG